MRIITTRRFLKKIIIFLLIIILFFLFKNNVSALTTTYNGSLIYNETTITNINNNQARINAMNTYFENIGTIRYQNTNYNITNGTYIIQVTNASFSSDTWTIHLVNNLSMQWWWRPSFPDGRLTFGGSGLELNINFNGNNVISHSVRGLGNYTLIDQWQTNGWSGNPMNEDIEVKVINYFDTYFLNNNQNINFRVYSTGSTTFYDIPLELNNVVNIPTIYINAKELFDSLLPNTELQISYELIKQNGYYDLRLNMENYTGETIQEGKQVFLVDTSTGKQTFISPDVNGLPNRTMVIEVYYPTTYKYQIIDTNTLEVIYEEIINIPSIQYENFLIKINNINTQNKTINYSYVNNGNTTNFKCYHQIENGSLLEDTNCTNIDNNYTINLTQNKNINFIIKDSENNIIFEESRNFIMSMAIPFIEFKENYEYNLLNIKVLFNRFNTTDYVAKYQINNEPIVTIVPTQEQTTYNDIYSYIIYNITEKSVIKAFIYDNNNNLIASSTFNISNTYIQQQNYYNIDSASFKDLFNNLSFKNISSELIDLINRIGNIILSSRLGIIIFTTFLISLIGLVINLIRR